MTTTQHQAVLKVHSAQIEGVKQVLFTGEAEPDQHPESYYLDEALYEDMGSPEVITVTVVAGDQLNEEPEESED